jgi:hypothetical protein
MLMIAFYNVEYKLWTNFDQMNTKTDGNDDSTTANAQECRAIQT